MRSIAEVLTPYVQKVTTQRIQFLTTPRKRESNMASINKVTLIGNLGADPEIRYMPDGSPVATFSVATSDSWKDSNGVRHERTEWHRAVMYRNLAELAGKYLQKGVSIYLEGRLRTRKWQDRNGADHFTTEIIGVELQMLGKREGDAGARRPMPAPSPTADAPSIEGLMQNGESLGEDDIPW